MALLPETRNVLQLGAAFCLIFLAFNSQGFIEEPVIESASKRGDIDVHAGYYSQSMIYAVDTFGNFVAAPIVDLISAKWAMVFGGLTYCVFLAGFLFLNAPYLYTMSCILGFGAALIWTGQGTYLAQNCTAHTSGRNSSIVWAILEGSLIGGGLFIFVVFKTTGTTDNIADSTTKIMYGVFTGLAAIGIVVIALLPAPPPYLAVNNIKAQKEDWRQLTIKTFRIMATSNFIILAPAFAYTGLMNSFWAGVYPSCISFTKLLGNDRQSLVAINAMVSGAGQCVAGVLIGYLSSRNAHLGRHFIVLMGTVVNVVGLVLVFINFPHDANLQSTDATAYIQPSVAIALIVGFLFGFGDGCWNTQIYAHLVANFPRESSQAFAVYKFYKSALTCAAFYYNSKLPVVWNLLIMTVTSLIAAAAFIFVELRNRRRSTDNGSSTDECISTDDSIDPKAEIDLH